MFPSRLWIAILAFLSLSTATFGRYALVIPAGGSANRLVGYTDTGAAMGEVVTPAAPIAAFSNYAGTAAIVISNSESSPVAIVQISNNQFVGEPTPIRLDGLQAKVWRLSPAGSRFAVLAADQFNTQTGYVLDSTTGLITLRVSLFNQGVPLDVAFNNDGTIMAILTTNRLLFVQVADGAVSTLEFQTAVANPSFLSVGPNGSFYVSTLFKLMEYSSRAPYQLLGSSNTTGYPGRLSFSPDGRYALTEDRLAGLSSYPNSPSAYGFDLNARDALTDKGAGTPLTGVTILSGTSSIALPLASVQIINETQAVGYSTANGKMYLLTYPSMAATEYYPGQSTPISGVSGLGITQEIPGSRTLWYNLGGGLFKWGLDGSGLLGPIAGSLSGAVSAATLSNPDVTSISAHRVYNASQTVTPSAVLTRPIYVRVFDNLGRPIVGASVSASAGASGATITNLTPTTNFLGYATAVITAPPTGTGFTVTFLIGGRTIEVVIGTGGTGGGGTPGGGTPGGGTPGVAGLVKIVGDGTVRQIGFPAELKLRAVGSDGMPIPNKLISWTETGGFQFLFNVEGGATSTTDADGYTTLTGFMGGSADQFASFKTYLVTASSDIGATTFTLVGYPLPPGGLTGPPTSTVIKPELENRTFRLKLGQTLTDAIRVLVTSSGFFTNLMPGAGISVAGANTDPNAGPVVACAGIAALTGADGVASCNLVATGKAGTGSFYMDVGWGFNQTGLFNFIVEPGDPVAPEITGGNNQTVEPNADLPVTLTALIKDGAGNILPNVAVAWEVVTPNSLTLFSTVSTSDINGRVSTRVKAGPTAGTFQLRVRIASGTLASTYNVTIVNVVSGFSKVSGDNQPTAVINTQFPSPLVVLVFDQLNRPLTGVQVNFAVSQGSATVSPAVATTNANGQASVTVTAGAQAGAIQVRATLQNFTPITWSLTSRLPGPVLTTQSFTNFATGEVGVVPGSLVLITGPGIAPNLRGEKNANMLTAQLPYDIDGVAVEFRSAGRSEYAPLLRIANINGVETALIQAPYSIAGATTVDVRVVSGGDILVNGVQVRNVGPGILEDTLGGSRAAILVRSDGLRVTPTNPARRGEIVRMYVIGLGQTTPEADTNRVGSPEQLVRAAVSVGLDDKGVTPMSVHLAENLIAVYEVVFRVPADAVIGNTRPLGLVMEATPGQPVYANGSIIAIAAQ